MAKLKKKIDHVENLKNSILSSLDDSKAQDIVVIDLKGKTNFADTMIIATGNVNKHVYAIAHRVANDLKDHGLNDIILEGREECNWILMDIGDIVVNIFRPETRELYNLEEMWNR